MDQVHQVLTGDIFEYVLSQYISRYDILSLYFAKLISVDLLYKIIIKNVESDLRDVFVSQADLNDFKKLLVKHDIQISGSFILHSLLGDIDKASDVDCYISNKDKLGIDRIKNLYEDLIHTRHYYEETHVNESIEEVSDIRISYYDGTQQVNKLNKKLSFISINVSITEHLKTYDINVVKNRFYYNRDNKKFELYIHNLKDIYNKVMKVFIERLSVDRIPKYINKGFKIKMPTFIEDLKVLQKLLPDTRKVRYFTESIDKGSINRESINRELEKSENPEMEDFNIFNGVSIPCDKSCCYTYTYFFKEYHHIHMVNLKVLERIIKHNVECEMAHGPSISYSDILISRDQFY